MILYTQKRLHNPETGAMGDSLRTVIASLLGVQPEALPRFDGPNWRTELQECMSAHGHAVLSLPYGSPDLPWNNGARQVYHGITGPSPRHADVPHTVVGLDGQPVHDPHPSRQGLAGKPEDWTIWLLVKR